MAYENCDCFTRAGFKGDAEELIPLLQFVQEKDGFISPERSRQIARFLNISPGRVYTVASFYAQFRFHPQGENHVRVCLGTACHVQGGSELSQEAQRILKIKPGQTSPDGKFDLEEVACLGCCAQAAVVEVNGKVHARSTSESLQRILEPYGTA